MDISKLQPVMQDSSTPMARYSTIRLMTMATSMMMTDSSFTPRL